MCSIRANSIIDRSPNCIVGGGGTRSPTQTTPQAKGCIAEVGPPRISAAALQQLTQWCQARGNESLGGPPCPTITAPPSPPAPAAHDTSRAAASTVAEPARDEASGGSDGCEPNRPHGTPAGGAEGGKASSP